MKKMSNPFLHFVLLLAVASLACSTLAGGGAPAATEEVVSEVPANTPVPTQKPADVPSPTQVQINLPGPIMLLAQVMMRTWSSNLLTKACSLTSAMKTCMCITSMMPGRIRMPNSLWLRKIRAETTTM
jgi:hypothetical protein